MSIKIENLSFTYMKGTPFEKKAIDNVSFEIQDNEFVAIIGHTGSGKSTLIQHMNGLLKPNSGNIYIEGTNITDKGVKLTQVRRKVGLVFQYPEYQLFEETVEKDIAFGPKNLGLNEKDIATRVKKAMKIVGLDYDTYKDKSPFELSGGQKRRVAIAGVVAMEPKILILDEPTNHLDMVSKEILENALNSYTGTILYVSHDRYFINITATRILELTNSTIVNYIGNYDYYEEKHDILTASLSSNTTNQEVVANSSASDWKSSKEEQAKLRKQQKDLQKTEEKISETEIALAEIDEMSTLPEICSNTAKLLELHDKKNELQAILNELYDKWEELSY